MWEKAIENFVSAAVYTLNFNEKKQTLKRKLLQLESMEADVMIELEKAELHSHKRPKNEVQNWLNNVGRVKKEVESIEHGVERGEWSILLKKVVEKKIEEVKELIDHKDKLQGSLVLDAHGVNNEDELLAPELVGQAFHINKDEICKFLLKDDVSSIGVYGMGGVGKTTLLAHVYNELLKKENDFRYVYWVTVSQDFSTCKLQNLIARTIGIDLSSENDEKKRAAKLSRVLVRKQKFVLVLDDLWDYFQFEKVGIPIGVNGCKLILTTRSLDICQRMGCQKNIRVEPLSEKEAWNLFEDKLGKSVPIEVKPIAESVVRECAGLPLGIITIAGSMRGVDDVREWRNALRELQESEVREGDMEFEVFRVLKFSYNRLSDSALQQCFLYCALFPEDHKIRRKNLIEYMIVEGIIEEMKSTQAKFDKGHSMLNKLEKLCLLEGGSEYGHVYVKMHDLIRDMAIQIMKVDPRLRAVVKSGSQLSEIPDCEKWTQDIFRISLMHNNINEIHSTNSPRCPKLSTLLLCNNAQLRSISDSFFEKLHGLKVLDLSSTGIAELPGSVSHLVHLNGLMLGGCKALRHVPSLALLKELRKLDLSYSGIEELPPGTELLSNLSYLDLRGTRMDELTPGILPMLPHLQFLMLDRSFTAKGDEVASLTKLENLNCRFYDVGEFNRYTTAIRSRNLSQYNLVIRQTKPPKYEPSQDWKGVCFYGCSIKKDALLLLKDVQYLYFDSCSLKRSSLYLENARELKLFGISKCDGIECLELVLSSPFIFQILEDITIDNLKDLHFLFSTRGSEPKGTFSCLKTFHLWNCPSMRKLFYPGLLSNLENLEEISVHYCKNLEELISMEQESHSSNWNQFIFSSILQFTLPKLHSFELKGLPELKSICGGTMICNSLQTVCIDDCPKLKRMPLSLLLMDSEQPSLLPSLQKIEIFPQDWWESVELDHPKAKNVLLPFCDFRKHERGTVRSNA